MRVMMPYMYIHANTDARTEANCEILRAKKIPMQVARPSFGECVGISGLNKNQNVQTFQGSDESSLVRITNSTIFEAR